MFDLRIDGGIARLILDRPEARNAIPAASWQLLSAALEETEASGARILLLSGSGGYFCAGADVKDFAAMRGDPSAASSFRLAMRGALNRLQALSIPSIAMIEGPCFGAGVALAMACDLRIAAADARFAITPAKFGISYPQEDIARLVSLVGPGQAARLLFSAQNIDGPEAKRIGLVEQDVGAGLPEAVMGLAEAIIAAHPDSLLTLKRGIALASAGAAEDEEQDRCFDALLASDTLAERLKARRG